MTRRNFFEAIVHVEAPYGRDSCPGLGFCKEYREEFKTLEEAKEYVASFRPPYGPSHYLIRILTESIVEQLNWPKLP